jgi:SulP family sulfate permease
MDQSGLYAMEDAIMDLKGQNIQVVFVNLYGQPLDFAKSVSMVTDLVPYDLCFDNFQDCTKWIEKEVV